MKKSRKKVESHSLRVYLNIVRRFLLNNFSWAVIVAVASAAAHASPALLVFADGTDFLHTASLLEKRGARLSERIPPRIVIADLPDGLSLPAGVERVHRAAVPVAELAPFGPLAAAAALRWNQRVLNRSGPPESGGFQSAAADMTADILPAPAISASALGTTISVSISPIFGASYYELEMATNETFGDPSLRTRVLSPEVVLPVPDGVEGPRFLRARGVAAIDRSDRVMTGAWSSVASVARANRPSDGGGPIPQPLSPFDGYDADGYTIILEWQPNGSDTRLQVAEEASFAESIVDRIVSGAEYVVPSPFLTAGRTYHWRIRSHDAAASAWSPGRRFKVNEPRHTGTDMFINPEAPR